MANVCDRCGKRRDVGHNVSHAKNRTQRVRKPNLHTYRAQTSEGKLRLTLCTKCLRQVKAVQKASGTPAAAA